MRIAFIGGLRKWAGWVVRAAVVVLPVHGTFEAPRVHSGST